MPLDLEFSFDITCFHTLLSAISIVLIRARCHQIDEKDNKKNPDEHGTFKDAA